MRFQRIKAREGMQMFSSSIGHIALQQVNNSDHLAQELAFKRNYKVPHLFMSGATIRSQTNAANSSSSAMQ